MTPLSRRIFPAFAIFAFLALAPRSHADTPDAITVDGGRYYGPIVNGKLQGRGRVEWSNGARYEGEFANGLMSGRGHMRYASGTVYEGEIRDGLMSGHGRLVIPDVEVYEGEFRQNLFWGQGEIRYEDGRKYRGPFVHGDFQGKGRFEYANGDVYEGDFERGKLTGNGSYAGKDGARYVGAFRNWQFHGPGRYVDASGNTYEGNFVDGSLEGPGKVSGNGTVYEGELKQWRYFGHGVLHLANGDVYRGRFENGLYEGQGTLTYAKPREDGRAQDSGIWHYGMLRNDTERHRILTASESAIYRQKELLDRTLASIKPRQPGRINMYLLAVAGDGSQEVFRREAEYVQRTFGDRFGTSGRSIVLANSRSTLDSAPMATVTSIRAALKAIGARMDRERDILFLFFTSHGSEEHELSLNGAAMPFRGLRAPELGKLLEESGIRWKVVVVSACYSGGFVDALRDERTLVITAARRDRRSFGCADENDFTYFGRAFFKEALPGAGSFQQAFRKASVLVDEWERQDIAKVTQAAGNTAKARDESHSLPQIRSPAPIEAQLKRWWAQLSPR